MAEEEHKKPHKRKPGSGQPSGSEGEGKNQPEQTLMMALSMEEYETMQKEIEESRKQAGENFEGWQRERADFNNYRRRMERDAEQLQQNMLGEVIKKYLVILDDLERALKNRPTQGEGAAWADGIELVVRKLQNMLQASGLERIPAENEEFDPNRHEAISHEECPGKECGQIIEVVQQGYMLGERVLRPSQVRVAK